MRNGTGFQQGLGKSTWQETPTGSHESSPGWSITCRLYASIKAQAEAARA